MGFVSTPKSEQNIVKKLWSKIRLAIRSKSKKENPPSSSETPEQITSGSAHVSKTKVTTYPTQDQRLEGSHSLKMTEPELEQSPVVESVPIPEVNDHPDSQIEVAIPSQHIDTMSPSDKEVLERRFERAQAIFRKYNLEFDEAGWEIRPRTQTDRVHKPPRMRVRWTCHECKTTFGHDKVCVECAHQRCKICIRHPPKKRKAMAAKKAAFAATITEPESQPEPEPEPAPEIQEGACHECQTPFNIGTEECSNCHHMICERCLQEVLAFAERIQPQTITS